MLPDEAWFALDVEVGHVVEFVSVEGSGWSLSYELEEILFASLDLFLSRRTSGAIFVSLLLELLEDVLSGEFHGEGLLHPWVVPNLLDGWSFLALIAEASEDQVLELFREALSTDFLPVVFVLSGKEEVVEVFVLFGLLEWENTLNDNEEDDSGRENVDLFSIIDFALLDFRSHVGHRASVGLELVDLLVSGEPEVSNFQIELIIDEDVLKFEVSVHDTFSLHVGQNLDHLRQEVASCVFAHASDRLAQIEEETAWKVLEKDVEEVLDLSARWLLDIAVGTISLNLYDIGMLEALENLNLLLDGLDGFLVSLEELLSQEFKGVALLRV